MKKTGIELIAVERQEQLEKHNWDANHDANHNEEELIGAALYALTEDVNFWPWRWDEKSMIKIAAKDYKERLIVAGALIAAEIDRLQYNEE